MNQNTLSFVRASRGVGPYMSSHASRVFTLGIKPKWFSIRLHGLETTETTLNLKKKVPRKLTNKNIRFKLKNE